MRKPFRKYLVPLNAWPSNENLISHNGRKKLGRALSVAEWLPGLCIVLCTLSFMLLPSWAIDALFHLLVPEQNLKLVWVYGFEAYLEFQQIGDTQFAKRFATTLWVTTSVWLVVLCVTTAVLVAYSLTEWTIPQYINPRRLVAFSGATALWILLSLSLFWMGFDYFSINGMTMSKPFPTTISSFPLFAIGPALISFMTAPWSLYMSKALMYWASESSWD